MLLQTACLLGRYDEKPFLIDNDDEIALIKDYRILDERGKGSVKAALSFELKHVPKTNTTKKPAV